MQSWKVSYGSPVKEAHWELKLPTSGSEMQLRQELQGVDPYRRQSSAKGETIATHLQANRGHFQAVHTSLPREWMGWPGLTNVVQQGLERNGEKKKKPTGQYGCDAPRSLNIAGEQLQIKN